MLKRFLKSPLAIFFGLVVLFFSGSHSDRSSCSLIRASTNLFQPPRHRL